VLDLDDKDVIVILYDLPAGRPWMPASFVRRIAATSARTGSREIALDGTTEYVGRS
jgi:hypothetical protein